MKENKTLNLIKFAIIIIVLIILCSCKAKKTHSTSIIKDSISEKTQLDIIRGSSGLTKIYEPCDENGNLRPIFFESLSGGLKTTVKDKDGSIIINQEQKQDTVYFEKIIYKDKSVYKDKLVEVPFIPKWVKKLLGISLGLNLLLLAWIFRKPLLRLIKPF